MPGLTLYRKPATRSFTVLWLLEELGVPYTSRLVTDDAELRRLNPSGMVPVLVDGDTVVHEVAAICLHLADRFPGLAPAVGDPARGAYLSWIVFAVAQLEPARAVQGVELRRAPGHWGAGWRPLREVLNAVAGALAPGPWLLRDRFTAADVLVGATLEMGRVTGELPPHPVLDAYVARLGQRPANARAAAINWG